MSNLRVPDNVGTFIFPRPMLWFSALCTAALGLATTAGGLQALVDPSQTLGWRVMPLLVGLTFGSMAALVVVGMLLRPRRSIKKLIKQSAGSQGITLNSSRRSDATMLVTIAVGLVTTGAGAVFATGGWRIALIILTALLVLPMWAMGSALRRPRWLRLQADGLESAALRSHTGITWDGLEFASLRIASGGGGQMVARLMLPGGTPGYREFWHNRWDFKRHAVDIEYMMVGVDGEALIRLIIDAITRPEVRPLLESDKERVLRSLLDPSGPWSTSESSPGTL